MFAAMVTLWNDIRLAYNKPTMGFIAPFLYSIYADHPEAFQDVVTGNNVRYPLLTLVLFLLFQFFNYNILIFKVS